MSVLLGLLSGRFGSGDSSGLIDALLSFLQAVIAFLGL